MKFIQKLCFDKGSEDAIHFYQKVFGCRIQSLIYYKDAVANGWASPCPEIDNTVYHSEIFFGDMEVRFSDLSSQDDVELTRKTEHLIGMDTAEEVEKTFALLAEGGEVVSPLERPPYMIIIGSVRDKYGILWTLMCDF